MTFPVPRIDDVDFEQLVAEAKARIPIHNPEWTHYNESDPGITLIELFAFMTESLVYRANQIPERNRLKFLQLLGIDREPAMPATGIVTFDATSGPLDTPLIEEGTELRAGSMPFVTDSAIDVLPVSAVACAKLASTTLLTDAEKSQYLELFLDFGPGDGDPILYETAKLEIPAGSADYRPIDLAETIDGSLWVALLAPKPEQVGSVRDQIGGKQLSLGVLPDVTDATRTLLPRSVQRLDEISRLVVSIPIAEVLPPPPAQKLPRYRQLVVNESADVLTEPGTLSVQLPPARDLELWDNLDITELGVGDFPPLLDEAEQERVVTWLRIRRPANETDAADSGTAPGLRLAWVGVNAVGVNQRSHVAGERLGRGTGRPDQSGRLGNAPVLPDSVRVTVDGHVWTKTDDLLAAPAEVAFGSAGLDRSTFSTVGSAQVFSCSADGAILFGNGLRGARPPKGSDIRVSYDYGGGFAGVVPAGSISTGVGLPAGVKVVNPIPTWGGDDAETVEDAETRIAKVVRHRNRLVTADDFEEITYRTPGVSLGRVEVLPLFHPDIPSVESPGVVTVMVIPAHDPGQPLAPRPDQMFINTICEYLDQHRLVTTEVHVHGPTYEPLSVSIGFDPFPGADLPPIREAITRAVQAYLSPLSSSSTTGQSSGGWRLGRSLDRLEILAEVARVPGVARISGVELLHDGTEQLEPVEFSGLRLPYLVGLSVQPGDPVPVESVSGTEDPSRPPRPILPIPAIPEDC